MSQQSDVTKLNLLLTASDEHHTSTFYANYIGELSIDGFGPVGCSGDCEFSER